jgi:membrane protein DedA with SNARE-associated domain
MDETPEADGAGSPGVPPGEPGRPAGDERPKPSRRKLVLIVTPIVVLTVIGTAATALTPALAAKHPLVLILMEARNRNLILARRVDFVPFLVVSTIRRTLSDPLYYLLGWYYGDAAVRWLEVKAGMGSYARLMERIFRKASYPAVFLFPGAVVCALAGVVGMRFGVFLALNLAGTVTAVLALKQFGDIFSGPVEAVVGFFDRHLVATTAVSIALVVLSIVAGRLQGKAEYSMRDLDELGRTEDGVDEEDPTA